MQNKTETKNNRGKQIYFIGGIGVVIIITLFFTFLKPPERSVAAYCKVYKDEKARLAKLPGDTYPSGVFNDSVSDAGEIATSLGRLERVAPNDISHDVKTLQGLYAKIDADPSQAFSAALSGSSIDDSVKQWTQDHCQ